MMTYLGVYQNLGEFGSRIMTHLTNSIYETGEWPMNVANLQRLPWRRSQKLQNSAIITNTAKVIERIHRWRIARKIEDELGEDQIGFRRRKEIGMLRLIPERNLDIEEELCVCFIDWQKVFDSLNWTKLMQILKGNVIDWHENYRSSDCTMTTLLNYMTLNFLLLKPVTWT
jgi:hypothetical protein